MKLSTEMTGSKESTVYGIILENFNENHIKYINEIFIHIFFQNETSKLIKLAHPQLTFLGTHCFLKFELIEDAL